MTAAEFIAAGGEIKVTLVSPCGESKTHTLSPVQHKRGSCGWRLKDEVQWLVAGEEVAVSIAMTAVVQKSGKWEKGKRRWSKDVADSYRKMYGTLPPGVEVQGEQT